MKDAISEQRLALVHPELARRVRAAADQLESTGTYFRVAVGMRTYAESTALYAQGRTTPGHIVSNARAGYSQHNHGFAVDCYPFVTGCYGDLNWDARSAQFKAMVAAMKQQGLVWGGDWQSIIDPPHFQLAGIPATPTAQDRLLFSAGGCAAVWQQYSNTITSLKAAAHLPWYALLWSLAVGAAQSFGRWLMDHFGHPVLTRFRQAGDNPLSSGQPPIQQPPQGDIVIDQEQQHQPETLNQHAESGTATDLQANAFTDVVKGIGKGIARAFGAHFTPDQTKALETSVVVFVGKDGLNLLIDAVEYGKTLIASHVGDLSEADKVAIRDAAKVKFQQDAAQAKKDLTAFAGSTFNWIVETGLQIVIAKGLQVAATAATSLHASGEEQTEPAK